MRLSPKRNRYKQWATYGRQQWNQGTNKEMSNSTDIDCKIVLDLDGIILLFLWSRECREGCE